MKKLLVVSLLAASVLAPSFAQAAPLYGSLIKGSGPAVYWYATPAMGGRRHVFPDVKTFYTWFSPLDFGRVNVLADEEIAAIPVGPNITYKPASRLIKIATDPKVYVAEAGNRIRWVRTEAIATALFGPKWQEYVDVIPDAFFVNYVVGAPINRAGSDYAPVVNFTPEDNIRNFDAGY